MGIGPVKTPKAHPYYQNSDGFLNKCPSNYCKPLVNFQNSEKYLSIYICLSSTFYLYIFFASGFIVFVEDQTSDGLCNSESASNTVGFYI